MAFGRLRILVWVTGIVLCMPLGLWSQSRIFFGDDVYLIIWTIDSGTGKVVRGFKAPAPAGGLVSGVGSLAKRSGLAFDGTQLFYTRATTNRLWVLDPDTGAVLRAFDKPMAELSGLATNGTSLFAVLPFRRGGPIFELDPNNGDVRREMDIRLAREALTFAGPRGSLFVPIGSLELREVNPGNLATLGSFQPPLGISGLGYSTSAGVLFGLGEDGAFYRVDPDNGAVLERFFVHDAGGDLLPPGSSLAADEAAPDDEAAGGATGGPGVGGGGAPPARPQLLLYEAQDVVATVGEVFDVPILLSTSAPVEGYVVALLHSPAALSLDEVTIDETVAEDAGADFVTTEIFSNGGMVAVVLDLLPPFGGQVIPPGEDQVIAHYRYECVQVDVTEEVETEVRFVDGIFGEPPQSNVVVVDGLSFAPDLDSGRVICRPRPLLEGGPEFICGGPPGPDGLPTPLSGGRGETVTLCFYYRFEDPRGEEIQGLSMALAYDCRLNCLQNTFRTPPESITAQVNADFVSFTCDNDPDDGDGCEMIFGVLVDSEPPFEGGFLPATEEPLLLGCVDLQIRTSAEVDECLEIRFRDGINGTGIVPVKNLVVVENFSFPVGLTSCDVCLVPVGPSLYCGAGTLDERGLPAMVQGDPGDEVEVCFWYRSPGDDILALTQTIRFDCRLECLEDTFRIVAPELETAEMVDFECENNSGDGDGCEIVFRAVLSSTGAPGTAFLPATATLRKLACVTMRIRPEAPRGRCLPLEHFDGINGSGGGLFRNETTLRQGVVLPDVFDCQVCVTPLLPKFFCGGATLGPDGRPVRVEAERGGVATVCLWYSSPVDESGTGDEVQGLSMALTYDCRLACIESSFRFPPGSVTEQVAPEFVQFHCDNNPNDGDGCEMIFGLLVDAVPPFEGRTLPPSDTPLKIAAVDFEVSPATAAGNCLAIRFRDNLNGRFRVPVKNLVSVNNQSVSPQTFDCEVCVRGQGPCFFCGAGTLGPNNVPDIPRGPPGSPVELCFWYCSPEDGSTGHLQFDHLQGLSMSLSFDCRLTCVEESFRIPPDSILAAVDAEFVQFHCDNDPNDGDGCEMVFGVLVDAFPPFDGRTLPPTDIPLKLACVDLVLPADARCGECFQVRFQDGLNGRFKVPVKNLVVAENTSFPAATNDCQICTIGTPVFVRGDCNFDGEVNVADAAMVVSSLFGQGTWKAFPPCLDACDANDDGRIDLGDAHVILIYVFNQSMRMLPDPGATATGPDPTADKIDCDVDDCPP